MTIILQTDRLLLREYEEGDQEEAYRLLSDPVTMSFWPQPLDREQAAGWVRRSMDSCRENGFGRWLVVDKSTGGSVGDCGLMRASIGGREEIDLGYIIHHPHWRRGYGFEAASACMEYGFARLGLERICANMPVEHTASSRVAEKLGMIKEKEFSNPRNRGIMTCLYAKSRSAAEG
ncbi:GNAT family N-acetyltransferase [Paenibacillus doosanensis]|uniref:GNAT family N-acetyltransferase n=1 Tax=Paenibacillus doosanensis TaxID=1229154 RepID=UPI00217F3CBD|nr:GNAT family N-acetyltransferase [Paenibacillus doosanensis]MCS7460243.1 GNAT family N-acetyltransferase [Paenibacillus doosanensis]